MPSPRSAPTLPAIIVALLLVAVAVAAIFLAKNNVAILFGAILVIAVAGAAALSALFPRKPSKTVAHTNPAEIAVLHRNSQDARNEIIGAMAILQQELRILQDARYVSPETKGLRDDLAKVGADIDALRKSRAASPAPAPEVKTTDEDDVPPLSFDDIDEKPLVRPAATLPRKDKPAPIFVPEAEPVMEKGLEPESMGDEGDWLTGGLEEEDLVVTKNVDFEAIVKKDAARPKPQIDEEEQRVLREEMAQMADEDDWVGGGLEDRDVKVAKVVPNAANEALMEKLRAEVEAKRAQKEASVVVRAPTRGETALIVNVTLPHGNKLFIRGVGPGLDPEKGAPMQQAAHGKWQWICPEKGKPCVVTVWENDETQAEGNPIRVPGGFALTVTPTFRRKLKLS